LWRNLRQRRTGDWSGDGTLHYPEERSETPAAFRGMPVLVARSDGEPRCVVCGRCGAACPTRCIRILGSEEDGLRVFDIDMSRCIFCGACEDACDDQAIVMSSHVEVAAFDRDALVFRLQDLLVPPEYLEKRLKLLGVSSDPPAAAEMHGSGLSEEQEGVER
jgi:NADH-quinone oxidoreductase subunit I